MDRGVVLPWGMEFLFFARTSFRFASSAFFVILKRLANDLQIQLLFHRRGVGHIPQNGLELFCQVQGINILWDLVYADTPEIAWLY